jgi:hypothetical protein
MGIKGRCRHRVVARCARTCWRASAWASIGISLVLCAMTVGIATAQSIERQSFTRAATSSTKPDGLCNARGAFPDANEHSVGKTTYLNRQLSVYEVLCTDFGKSSEGLPKGDVFCTLLAAAIGTKFEKDELYVDGACASKSIVTHEDPAGVACGGLVTFVGAVSDLAPELKAYAAAAGVACDVGHSLGSWIETQQEAQAAKAVWRRGKNALKPGACLKFVPHGFPIGDDWLATPCSKNDRGFAYLPVACLLPHGGEGGFALEFSAVGIRCSVAFPVVKDVIHFGGPCNGKNLTGSGCRTALGFVCRVPRPARRGYVAPGDRAVCAKRTERLAFFLPG